MKLYPISARIRFLAMDWEPRINFTLTKFWRLMINFLHRLRKRIESDTTSREKQTLNPLSIALVAILVLCFNSKRKSGAGKITNIIKGTKRVRIAFLTIFIKKKKFYYSTLCFDILLLLLQLQWFYNTVYSFSTLF